MYVLAEAEQRAVPVAVAKSVVTAKLFPNDEEAVIDPVDAGKPAGDTVLAREPEPKVSCTSASIASAAAAGSVGHIAYPTIAVRTTQADRRPFANCL